MIGTVEFFFAFFHFSPDFPLFVSLIIPSLFFASLICFSIGFKNPVIVGVCFFGVFVSIGNTAESFLSNNIKISNQINLFHKFLFCILNQILIYSTDLMK